MTAGQPADLLGEGRLRARRGQAEETPRSQADQHLPAARGRIEQPPLVAAVHPPGHRPAPRAGGRRAAGPGLDTHRPASGEDPLYQHIRQVRQQDISNIKNARRAMITKTATHAASETPDPSRKLCQSQISAAVDIEVAYSRFDLGALVPVITRRATHYERVLVRCSRFQRAR
jgi:hypothetical protein